ncbi:MAG: UDP-3-O-(3-hydroxymyristoyl)glucosamine N-acyltransferase [Acidobacteria bacterium]|nr:MAG: UDP-3-O-(3-hydroxymyristoyl)glucosamine N-acyltransferase [Acidobacteriota bacterium]
MRSTELAGRIGAVCEGGDVELNWIASFAGATAQSLVFVEHERFLEDALASQAGAMIVPADAEIADSRGKVLLRSRNPRLAFALAAEELKRSASCPGRVDASAIVDSSADVHPTARVDELVVIGAGAKIGARSHIGPGSVIGPGVVIGEDCNLVARVVVFSETTMEDRVTVKAGAVLGSDGYGFVRDAATGRYHKFPQTGRLEIGNDVEIGANTTVDRGALDATVISEGAKLDNLVHVGHNVRVGRNVIIVAQTGISGSSVLEDNVVIGGQVGIADHVRIESGVIVGAQSGIPSKKVLRGKGVVFWGTPARPITDYLKELATLSKLTRKKK